MGAKQTRSEEQDIRVSRGEFVPENLEMGGSYLVRLITDQLCSLMNADYPDHSVHIVRNNVSLA